MSDKPVLRDNHFRGKKFSLIFFWTLELFFRRYHLFVQYSRSILFNKSFFKNWEFSTQRTFNNDYNFIINSYITYLRLYPFNEQEKYNSIPLEPVISRLETVTELLIARFKEKIFHWKALVAQLFFVDFATHFSVKSFFWWSPWGHTGSNNTDLKHVSCLGAESRKGHILTDSIRIS
jgi:hypothetical protein